MLEINGKNIEVSRQDTGQYTITFSGADKPEDGAVALVSLKKTKNSDTIIWEKRYTIASDIVTVTLTSQDTDQPFGQYWWDVRILFRDGTVFTPMLPASFKVVEVIGDVT
jgi:hypothetical protein